MSAILALLVMLSWAWGKPQKTGKASARPSAVPGLEPSPEIERLLKAFAGTWRVNEDFEVSASKQGKTRRGTATFREGPGFSLIEDYTSNGSAGELHFLGVLWWDANSQAYRFFTCANNSGCDARGVAHWEGNNLVNTWEEEINGKKVSYKDSFINISPSSFTLVSEGIADETTTWHVTTRYTRLKLDR